MAAAAPFEREISLGAGVCGFYGMVVPPNASRATKAAFIAAISAGRTLQQPPSTVAYVYARRRHRNCTQLSGETRCNVAMTLGELPPP